MARPFPGDFGFGLRAERGRIHISRMSPHAIQIAMFPFRSLLLRESLLVSLPSGTKMFQFPEFPVLSGRFGNLGFKGCMRLPQAYRSLPRPSSASKPRHPPSSFLHSNSEDPKDLHFFSTSTMTCGTCLLCFLIANMKILFLIARWNTNLASVSHISAKRRMNVIAGD